VEMSEKSTKFWTILLLMVLGTSVLVMMIDFSIKGAILEESLKLRREMARYGQGRIPPDNSNVSATSGDTMVLHPTGMEEGSDNGAVLFDLPASPDGRSHGRRAANNPRIQPGTE
jgi:hypothetical protein